MAVILFGVFIALLLLGVPVAFAICSAAATTMFAGFGDAKMMIVVQRMFASCDSFSLIAVPFFIFAGDLLAGGRISKVLVEFCESLLGMIKGGLSVVSVLAGMFFAAISGSGAATTAAVGATLVPELKKRGYREDSAAALVAAAGTIGVVIPPSVMPAIILGGIFSGYFTPSEAAAVAVVYALLVSTFVYRDMSLKKLYTTMLGSAKTSAVIMIIIACSGPFGWALANWKIPEAISSAVLSVSTNKYVILFLISLIILVAGVFMETSSAIIILTPVFLPLVRALGISTLHFGILFVVGIAIGMITPPVAINLFVASGITGLSLEKISKAVVPYLIGLIVVFLAIVYLPLFIPGFIG